VDSTVISNKKKRLVMGFAVSGLALLGLVVQPVVLAAEAAAPMAADEPPPPATNVSPDYRIGPGDTLQVFVWRNPELSTSVPVRPDGKISTPLVENMTAVGKTPSQLARDMESVLNEFIRSPKVNIIVTGPTSTLSQVRVIGQVAKPMGVPFREGMTVLDLVLQVGGLSQFAAGNRAKIVREDAAHPGGKPTEIRVRLADLVNKGDMSQNVTLKSGDVLVVPQTLF
jgi:polysaccharide biosynthesis/export protein